MNNIIYNGPFKDHIQNHVKLKKAVGYKYDTEAIHLKRFDQFTIEKYPETTSLTKEIVLDWCSKKTYEAQANQSSRASIIRQFGKYLDSLEYRLYYSKRLLSYSKTIRSVYLFDNELSRFFAETDKCRYSSECPHRHLIMPVIFRMIYMCGLRVSEARLLKVADVDLKNGILNIHQSKKDNSRLVPMSDL